MFDRESFDIADEIPESAWLIRNSPQSTRQSAEAKSRLFALAGLGLLFVITGIALPVEFEVVTQVFPGRPSALVMLVIYQVLLFPATVVFACSIVACLFRGGSLTKNYLVAFMITLPGPAAFMFAMAIVHEPFGAKQTQSILVMLFTYYVAAGLVATTCQLWTRWTLVSLNLREIPIERASTWALIELTAIAAIFYAIVVAFDPRDMLSGDMLLGILLFAALGILSASAVISFLIGFLGGNRAAKRISVILVFGAACTLCSVMAHLDLRWTFSLLNFVTAGSSALVGTAIMLLMMGICMSWLKACGWSCVK